MNTTDAGSVLEERRRFRPKFELFKPNGKGTGGALQLELVPAGSDDEGCIMVKLASQITVGSMGGPNPVFPRFDWEHALAVKLNFEDLSMLLQVFRGECESLGEGKGVYHRSASGMTRINLRHLVEPVSGYVFEVSRTRGDEREGVQARVMLSPHEATGIEAAITDSLGLVCFGLPMRTEADEKRALEKRRGGRNEKAS